MHNANVAKELQCTIGQPVKGEGLPINTEENKMDQRIVLNENILRQKVMKDWISHTAPKNEVFH